jgi:hypothetical protein
VYGCRPYGQIGTAACGVRMRYQEFIKMKATLSEIDIFVVLINGIGVTLLLLEMRTVPI